MLVVTDPVVGRSVCHDFGYALAVREPERVKPTKALQPTKARAFTRNAKDRKDERYSLSRPRQTLPRARGGPSCPCVRPSASHPALVRPSHSSSAIRCQVAAELPFPQLPLRFPFSSAPFVGSLSQPLWEASHNLGGKPLTTCILFEKRSGSHTQIKLCYERIAAALSSLLAASVSSYLCSARHCGRRKPCRREGRLVMRL